MARFLYLLRHGEPEAGYTGRYLGRLDPGLSPHGREQALRIAPRVRALAPEVCLSSPLRRARETAEAAAGACGLAVLANDALLEIDFGALEGKTFREARALYPAAADSWRALSSDFDFPGGENFAAFRKRTREMADWARDCSARSVLMVAHGGVLRGVLCELLGVAANGPLRFRLAYASLTCLELFGSGRAALHGFNVGRELPPEMPA